MLASCVNCHNTHPDSPKTNWKTGDVRGILEVNIPLNNVLASTDAGLNITIIIYSLLSILGIIGIILMIKKQKDESYILKTANDELLTALDEIKTLQGIIPICSYCNDIRNDEGAWVKIDVYISKHTDARFSHSICPKCMPGVRSKAGLDQK